MDTPPIEPRKWSNLTRRARLSEPPEIDVRHAVRRAITAPDARVIAGPNSQRWLIAPFAALTVIALTSSYFGILAATELSFALDITLPF